MGASELPVDLARAWKQFRAWRAQQKPRSRIPQALWKLAVRLANRHGLNRTATVLGLDYYSLKKQVEAAAGQPRPSDPAFVELPSPVVVGKQCVFERNNGAGATKRLQLVGYDAADIETLARSFWSGP
jgi:hypothetical protein